MQPKPSIASGTSASSIEDAVDQYASTLALIKIQNEVWMQLFYDKGLDFPTRDNLIVQFMAWNDSEVDKHRVDLGKVSCEGFTFIESTNSIALLV